MADTPMWLLWMVALGGLVLLTSFAKMTVVLSLLRNALGAPGIPSTLIITAWAAVLTAIVMAPVAIEAERTYAERRAQAAAPTIPALAKAAESPMKAFLTKHAHADDVGVFERLAAKSGRADAKRNDWLVVAPAFVVSEMREALMLGLVLMLPFLILDLVAGVALSILGVANVPVASVALPLKLLLFLIVDGWLLVSEGLVGGYFA